MLLLKYFDPQRQQLDKVAYLKDGLQKSLDQVVEVSCPAFSKELHVAGRGKVRLNNPIKTILSLSDSRHGH